jgi:putative two-component system response regulator
LPSPDAIYTDARIVVVDDEPDMTSLLDAILQTAGYSNVTCLHDPREFQRAFPELAPDLVLLDLGMPGVQGSEILSWIRVLTPVETYLPVLVLTGHSDAETKRRALADGASDFLAKPPDIDETLLRIGNLLETRMLHTRLQSEKDELEHRVAERTEDLALALGDLAKAHTELRSLQEETIRRLAAAAEFRDGETARHLERIGIYSAILAGAIGMDDESCDLIRLASPMHDIGKISVPDRVLLKTTLLTPAEYEVMKTHSEIGYRILAGSNSLLLATAARIALTHHERWDGGGYPRGLAGEDIPLEGRIVAVADAYDSMTSVRRYKDAIQPSRAAELLRADVGTHFDPSLVDAFLAATMDRTETITVP